MGVHSEVAAHFGIPNHPPHASTMDYVVGAAAACLAGTFARALKARDIEIGLDEYEVEARGELYNRDGVLVIERIVVTHKLCLPEDKHPVAQRVLGFYERACSVGRSLKGSIEIESRLEFV